MSYSRRFRGTETLDQNALGSSPLRHSSNASTDSSAISAYSDLTPPNRSSTVSSTNSSAYRFPGAGHKRGISEASGMASTSSDGYVKNNGITPAGTYKSMRQSLRPLPQPPGDSTGPTRKLKQSPQSRKRSSEIPEPISAAEKKDNSMSTTLQRERPHSVVLSRADSTAKSSVHYRPHAYQTQTSPHTPAIMTAPELVTLQKSTTSHLRTLSKFAQNGSGEDFSITSPAQEVAGLHGRRRLQREGSVRNPKTTVAQNSANGYGWGERNWMDKQRTFLQAYEYLCHIGEAKEWIEDIIRKPIPPIVQLEEALRDGVTLAEIVQALQPERPLRIFRHPKLQFRHSDNIALFFRFLADTELPELFRFELIDLYEKKNIPKVIYCIHALSWLLYRKGLVDFRIGNLVGQLEFEHHELEEMQKGLEKAGVSMPKFSGMGASFGAEAEPEPEPIETEEERVIRELTLNEEAIKELQAQARGAIVRLRLGNTMQGLWEMEETLIDLQSRIRGDWARQIMDYRLGMMRFAIRLQSATRGFLLRSRYQRMERRFRESSDEILKFQSVVRSRNVRLNLQQLGSDLQRRAQGIIDLQSTVRGALGRALINHQLDQMESLAEGITHFQAIAKGMLWRRKGKLESEALCREQGALYRLQAVARGALQRMRIDTQHQEAKGAERDIRCLQAAIRGKLARNSIAADGESLQKQCSTLGRVQAAIKGVLARRRKQTVQESLQQNAHSITHIQATMRGKSARLRIEQQKQALLGMTKNWTTFQSLSRGNLLRKFIMDLFERLAPHSEDIKLLQAAFRGASVRRDVGSISAALKEQEGSITRAQSMIRGCLLRKNCLADKAALVSHQADIVELQSLVRGGLLRQANREMFSDLDSCSPEVVELQGLARAMLLRASIGTILEELELHEDMIVDLQAAARAKLVRGRFGEKKRFFKQNMEKVVKIQSFVRARLQGEAYKSLTSGTNPPVGTIKGFVHLLNDSDFDFDEEVEFEQLRKIVVQHVRQNEMAEQYIDQLDIKIALLVKNKITLDEVVKHQKHFGGHVGSLLTNNEISSKDPFDLKALNKNSRKKLEHYQQLFFILQTQPQYLARLFKRIREQGTAEKDCKRIENLMMGLFGYSQKRREEYYLLKLISRSLKEEVDGCASIQDYLRGNFFWGKLLNGYIRSPRDRKYMRDLIGPLVKENIIENPELDLESDPMQIYRSAINNEELRTGQRSSRGPDIAREEAIRDPETRETFIHHLQDLRDIADQFFVALEESLQKMPYGIRFVAQQSYQLLCSHFSSEDPQYLLQVVGHWVWKSYLQPPLTQPETWGVVDRGLTPLHKRNLGEVGKVLGQIAAGKLFGGDNIYLQPLNSYVGESIARMGEIWESLVSVQDAEAHFDIDEFNDLYARTKPTLYIKMADIFAIHQLVSNDLNHVCPTQDDILREVVRELGNAKINESEMMGVSSTEINLTLNPKLHDVDDPDAEVKSLFMETKRCILYIIRVQSAPNLMEIMVKPITMDDEDRWSALLREEFSSGGHKRAAYSDSTTLTDITAMSYSELKRTALESILRLEQFGRLTRHNYYQDLLNAIAVDIRTKHRRRVQRQKELEGVRLTLGNLNEKALWLEQQLKSYNDYIEQAMVTLQNKKGKKRFLLPFTKQYNHERELQRSGRVPKFGSFKYSARSLADKGVLVSWQGYAERQWDRVNLTISSDEVGIFFIEGSMGSIQIPGASAQVPLDDLLQAQFNNHQFMNLFEGGLRLNVNLFLHLLFRKFYRDE
ncbi:MAG: hypothetical protein M1836_006675 [Candelina mexicana]|nr:MAG: hypothetical protein M1836_006675 [Candelina mexicana]